MNQRNENIVNILLDAGRGEVSKLSVEGRTGERIGELPRASRRGYEFEGWYTKPDGGERVNASTTVTSGTDFTLYAHYRRSEVKKRSMFRLQRRVLIILLAAVLALGAAAFVVLHFVVDTYTYTDPADGTVYYVRRVYDTVEEKRVWKLTASDGSVLPLREYATSAKQYEFYETIAGTWVQVTENGKATTYAVVDTDGSEQVGFGDRVLMYPSIPSDEIYSIDVANDYGSFTITQDQDGHTYIKGMENKVAYPNAEMFASLASHCGYTLSASRVENPIRDADGSFRTEYGLDGSRRFTVTRAAYDKSGRRIASDTSYTVYIGDALPSDGGYYVQLEGRDKVYIFSTAGASSAFYHPMNETLLSPVENLVSPMFTYPMSSDSYYDVKNFYIARTGTNFPENPDDLSLLIEFSFVPSWKRTGTLSSTVSYVCDFALLGGFDVNSTAANAAMYDLYRVQPRRCVKLNPTEEDLKAYGLENYRYLLHFGMWLNLTSEFTDGNGQLISGFLPDDAKVAYRNTYSSTETASDANGEHTFDMLVSATLYSFTVKDNTAKDGDGSDGDGAEKTLEYRVTVAKKAYYYGGEWLKGDALERELDSDAYSYRSEYGCDYRYDAATGCYFYRADGYVYYGKNAVRMKDYDTSGASVERLLENAIAISEKTADGTYYVYNELCAQIAEVDEEYLSFLSWESTSWVETAFFPIPLAYVTGIDLTSATTEIRFRMDNSRSDQSEGYDSTDINIKGEDKNGNSFDSWGCMTFYCSQTGNGKTINSTWRITPTEFSVRNTDTGERLRFTGDNETAINAFGETVQVISTPLVTTDGSRVTVGADYITVVKDGETVKYPRYTVQNFRQFYKALMYATLEGSADLSEADPALRERIEDAIRSGDDSVCQLVLRITCEDTAGENAYGVRENTKRTYVFRFYQYTKGKSYITAQVLDADGNEISSPASGDGFRFYVRSAFVDKLIADARRVMENEAVIADSKN